MKILVVDDEVNIHEIIREYGKFYGHQVDSAATGSQALDLVERHDYDAVLMDIMMPDMDGFRVTKRMKQIKPNMPIIMLSARHQEEDKLYGFDLGIDDYMTKPFSVKELMARIKVVVDRNQSDVPSVMVLKDLTIDPMARLVYVCQKPVHLTLREYDLLLFLVDHAKKLVSRQMLLSHVWPMDFEGDERVVDVHIRRLRKQLGPLRNYIQTVRGLGYRFDYE